MNLEMTKELWKKVFYDILLKPLEEIVLAKAIEEGRKNDFVDEETIFSILEKE